VAAVPQYLVFFVVDTVDDALAAHVRARVRMLARSRAWRDQPGFFDDPASAGDTPRTTGGYLRVDADTADGDEPVSPFGLATGSRLRRRLLAFCAAVQAFSAEFSVDVELQWREAILGRVRAGVPDDSLEEALAAVTGEA
jgi:hypothetical protein